MVVMNSVTGHVGHTVGQKLPSGWQSPSKDEGELLQGLEGEAEVAISRCLLGGRVHMALLKWSRLRRLRCHDRDDKVSIMIIDSTQGG